MTGKAVRTYLEMRDRAALRRSTRDDRSIRVEQVHDFPP